MTPERRLRVIEYEQRAWLRYMEHYVNKAREAGYRVEPIDDNGGWRLEAAGKRHVLASDSELFLFLVDQGIVQVQQLPEKRSL